MGIEVIVLAVIAAVLAAGCVITFFIGRRHGQAAEAERLAAAKSGAEDVRRRTIEEAGREAGAKRSSGKRSACKSARTCSIASSTSWISAIARSAPSPQTWAAAPSS